MPNFRTELTFLGEDRTWLGSTHALENAQSVILDISTFTEATYWPNGYLPSGLPLAKVSGLMVPYVSGGSGGTNILSGFLATAQEIKNATEDINVPMVDHGRVITAKVNAITSVGFVAPVTTATNLTTIVFE